MEHDFYTSKDIEPDDNWGQLNIVDGGLSLCKVCGGLEGGLPTNCPGERMAMETQDKVYRGEIDFIESEGWINKISQNSPEYWRRKRMVDGFEKR